MSLISFPSLPLKLEHLEMTWRFASSRCKNLMAGTRVLPCSCFNLFPPCPTACPWFLFNLSGQLHGWVITSCPPSCPITTAFWCRLLPPPWMFCSPCCGPSVPFAQNSSSIVTLSPTPTLTPCQLTQLNHQSQSSPDTRSLTGWSWLMLPLWPIAPMQTSVPAPGKKNSLNSRVHKTVCLCLMVDREQILLFLESYHALHKIKKENELSSVRCGRWVTRRIYKWSLDWLCNMEVVGDLW